MRRLYKIENGRLWRIGNAENLSPSIDIPVEVSETIFWLEVRPDLPNAEDEKAAAQIWANTDTTVIDDNDLHYDIRLYDWVDGKLAINAERIAEEQRRSRLAALHAEKAKAEAELAAEDYKVIKCAEAQVAGAAMPYDVDELHAAREAKRERINIIEMEVAAIESKGATE